MKSDKFISGGIVTGAVLCSLIAFNTFTFSSVLAASSGETIKQEIVSSTISESLPEETDIRGYAEKPTKDPEFDEIAITEEQAVEFVAKKLEESYAGIDFRTIERKAAYFEATSPASPSKWVIFFGKLTRITEQDNDINYKQSTIIIHVELDSLTGDIIYQGETSLEKLTDGE